MTQDEIIRMAREAGSVKGEHTVLNLLWFEFTPDQLERFAALVAEATKAQPQGEWVEIVDGDVHEVMKHTNPARHPQLFARAVITKFKEKNTPPVVPQGEPVAWVVEDICAGQFINGNPRRIWWECMDGVGIPFYTTPPYVEAAIEANDDDTDKALELVWHMQSQIDVAVKAAIEATKEKLLKSEFVNSQGTVMHLGSSWRIKE